MSNTIPPSEQVRQQLQAFLREGIQTSTQPSSELLRLAGQVIVQELLEQEVTDFLGRERYERRADGEEGYRNGYEPSTSGAPKATLKCVCRKSEPMSGHIGQH